MATTEALCEELRMYEDMTAAERDALFALWFREGDELEHQIVGDPE